MPDPESGVADDVAESVMHLASLDIYLALVMFPVLCSNQTPPHEIFLPT